MQRTNIIDDARDPHAHPDEPVKSRVVGWFDLDAATAFEERRIWDDGSMSAATHQTGRHETMYRTSGGRWVLCSWSQWVNQEPAYREVDEDAARLWLIAQEEDEAVQRYFGELKEEEEASRGGRPTVGQKVETRLPDEVLTEVQQYASAHGLSRAQALRNLIVIGIGEVGAA